MTATREPSFLCTSIGKKYLMGITGLIWAGFVFAHMAGNLLVFLSADAYNSYGHTLTSGYFIYLAETVLGLAFVTHVVCAISLVKENRAARGSRGYAVSAKGEKAVSLASQTMAVHGTIILIFIISHLVTFKFGPHYETTVNGVVMRDLFKLMVEVFKQPMYLAWYVISLALLFFHLKHGVASIVQSFGILNERMQKAVKCGAFAYALIVSLGFISQPIFVFLFN